MCIESAVPALVFQAPRRLDSIKAMNAKMLNEEKNDQKDNSNSIINSVPSTEKTFSQIFTHFYPFYLFFYPFYPFCLVLSGCLFFLFVFSSEHGYSMFWFCLNKFPLCQGRHWNIGSFFYNQIFLVKIWKFYPLLFQVRANPEKFEIWNQFLDNSFWQILPTHERHGPGASFTAG